jgi:hypothetical protein
MQQEALSCPYRQYTKVIADTTKSRTPCENHPRKNMSHPTVAFVDQRGSIDPPKEW